MSGVVLEIEGSVQPRYKRARFTIEKVLKRAPLAQITHPYVHSTFTFTFNILIFEKANNRE